MGENDRLETLIQKMQEHRDKMRKALDDKEYSIYPEDVLHCCAILRLAIAELSLIRDQYERKIAELEEIIANAENDPGGWSGTMGDE